MYCAMHFRVGHLLWNCCHQCGMTGLWLWCLFLRGCLRSPNNLELVVVGVLLVAVVVASFRVRLIVLRLLWLLPFGVDCALLGLIRAIVIICHCVVG